MQDWLRRLGNNLSGEGLRVITVRVDGVLLGTQREMLLELPDVRLVERLLDAGEGACQETDVLVLSGSERIPSALGHRFPELKLLVLSRFRGRECLPDLPAGAELVVLPQSREPLLGDWVWSHLLGMRWHVGHRVPGSLMPRENLHMAGPLVLSGGSELVNHVAHRALAWGLAVWSPQDGGGCLASGVEQVSWREALKGGGTFCFLDERPAPHRDLGEAELAKVRRGAVFFAPKALRDPAPLVRLLLEGHLGALAFVPERLEPEPALGVHPGFYPLDLDFETLWRRTFSPEEGLARVIADYFNV